LESSTRYNFAGLGHNQHSTTLSTTSKVPTSRLLLCDSVRRPCHRTTSKVGLLEQCLVEAEYHTACGVRVVVFAATTLDRAALSRPCHKTKMCTAWSKPTKLDVPHEEVLLRLSMDLSVPWKERPILGINTNSVRRKGPSPDPERLGVVARVPISPGVRRSPSSPVSGKSLLVLLAHRQSEFF